MLSVKNVPVNLVKFGTRTKLIAQKYAPEACLITGIGCIIGGTVMLCKESTKASAIMDEYHADMDKVDYVLEHVENMVNEDDEPISYTEADHKKDLMVIRTQTVVKFAKLYAPGFILTVSGIGLILASYGILKKRNIALTVAYNGINEAFMAYRKRVAEAVGEEAEDDIYHGVRREKVTKTVTDENGKKQKVTEEEIVVNDPNGMVSPYARYFDEGSRYWSKDCGDNHIFLRAIQNSCNDKLRMRGHLFLNEVYDLLDIPRSKAGAVVGWVVGNGDGFVDFGLYTPRNQRFINGLERTAFLDFNVDGVIYDLI